MKSKITKINFKILLQHPFESFIFIKNKTFAIGHQKFNNEGQI